MIRGRSCWERGKTRERIITERGARAPCDFHGRGRGTQTLEFVGRGLGEGPSGPTERKNENKRDEGGGRERERFIIKEKRDNMRRDPR